MLTAALGLILSPLARHWKWLTLKNSCVLTSKILTLPSNLDPIEHMCRASVRNCSKHISCFNFRTRASSIFQIIICKELISLHVIVHNMEKKTYQLVSLENYMEDYDQNYVYNIITKIYQEENKFNASLHVYQYYYNRNLYVLNLF